MPTLHWIGKDKVINHHMDVPFKVLEHAYDFDNRTQIDHETKSGNKIIHHAPHQPIIIPRRKAFGPSSLICSFLRKISVSFRNQGIGIGTSIHQHISWLLVLGSWFLVLLIVIR